jgi:GTP 3',8-cyclase
MIEIKGLEYSVIQNCNYKCPLCSHQSWRAIKKSCSVDRVVSDLTVFSKSCHIPFLKIIGGEPLLHPEILEIMKQIYPLKITDWLVLSTNGSLLLSTPEEIFNYFDEIYLSAYKGTGLLVFEIKRLCEMKRKKLNVHDKRIHFDVIRFEPCSEEEAQERYSNCFIQHQGCCFSLHEGYLFKCGISQAMPYWIREFQKNFDYVNDCANILDQKALEELVTRKQHLEACHYCTGKISWKIDVDK